MRKEIDELLEKLVKKELELEDTRNELLLLFGVSERYSMVFRDGDMVWHEVAFAMSEDNAVKELMKLSPNAELLRIKKL